MATYHMIDTTIEINYIFDRYYKDNLESYITKQNPIYIINTYLVDEIDVPNLKIINQTVRKKFFQDDLHDYALFHLPDKTPIILIKRQKDFKKYDIYLNKHKQSPLDGIEYTIHQTVFMEIALSRGFLPLHASAFLYKNKAILISGPSGTGKTTLSSRMNLLYGYEIINDDKPLLKVYDDQVYVYSSPFSGKEALNMNLNVPLGYIVFIAQGSENKFYPLTEKEAINELLRNMFRPDNAAIWDIALDVSSRVIHEEKMIRYACLNENSAGHTLENYLKEVIV